jgi:hypothetical protein
MPLRAPATAIKARLVCDQVHQQLKQELGLWHFDGWFWTRLHRRRLYSSAASLGTAGRRGEAENVNAGPTPSQILPAVSHASLDQLTVPLATRIAQSSG